MFTNLLPFATRFLINAEMDDAGIIEPATCKCAFAAAGLNLRIRDIFSYGKLTGQGITLMGSDIVRILESAMPQRFGGGPGDYQLVEHDGARQTQLVLRISPRVGVTAKEEVRSFFLDEVRRCYGGSLAARQWQHSEGVEVAIEEPAVTSNGKVLSLHMLTTGSGKRGAHAS
jgi:hypothetical protein